MLLNRLYYLIYYHFSSLVAIFKTSFSYYSEKKGNPGNDECQGQLLLFFFLLALMGSWFLHNISQIFN